MVKIKPTLPSTADLSIYDIDEILVQNGQTISIRLRRNDVEFAVDLPLRLPFEYPPNWARIDKESEDFDSFLRELENDAPSPPETPAPATVPR